jgi:hypothetical protein
MAEETKIRRGQAFNLAVHDAIHNNQENNPTYIYKKFLYYHKLADVVQGSDFDLIQKVIDCKKFDDVLKTLEEVMK